jgi:hypothetical protein
MPRRRARCMVYAARHGVRVRQGSIFVRLYQHAMAQQASRVFDQLEALPTAPPAEVDRKHAREARDELLYAVRPSAPLAAP